MTRVISPEDAARAARRWFLAHGDVDMHALADELAVARATLYRTVGGRDRLLGVVLADLGELAAQEALADAARRHPPGVERLVDAAFAMNTAVVGFTPVRRLIRQDPETAVRVLFGTGAGVHERAVAVWTPPVAEALAARGGSDPGAQRADVGRVAYMFVRIGESAIYADLLSDREPDLELARDLQRALLTL